MPSIQVSDNIHRLSPADTGNDMFVGITQPGQFVYTNSEFQVNKVPKGIGTGGIPSNWVFVNGTGSETLPIQIGGKSITDMFINGKKLSSLSVNGTLIF